MSAAATELAAPSALPRRLDPVRAVLPTFGAAVLGMAATGSRLEIFRAARAVPAGKTHS